MSATLNLYEILTRIKELDSDQQNSLLEKLKTLVRKNKQTDKPEKLSSISGVGKKIWERTNIDEYIDQQRQW
jgi:hypothetical protein